MITVPRILRKSLIGLALLAAFVSSAVCHAEVLPGANAKSAPEVQFNFQLELPKGSSEATFIVAAKIPINPISAKPYHIYSTRTSDGINGDRATLITLDKNSTWEFLGDDFKSDHAPHSTLEDGLGTKPDPVEQFERKVTWKRKLRLKATGTSPEQAELSGVLSYQICDDRSCSNPKVPFRVPVTIVQQEVAQALPPVDGDAGDSLPAPGAQKGAEPKLPSSEAPELPDVAHSAAPRAVVAEQAAPNPEAAAVVAAAPAGPVGQIDKSKGLMFFLLSAVGFGFAALLTPCVFPMIPITITFFSKQAEKEHHRPITMAIVYCLGIIGTFTLIGMFVSIAFRATALNEFASGTAFSLFLSALLLFFAFSLLGMYEIRVPSWLLTATAGQQSRGGYIGVLFMALTFTLTSFTCTFAFAGGLLVMAAEGDRLWPVLGLLAFSSAFALPFFFLALFPSLMQRMPKSGGWMNIVKVIMGMIEIGAAFKFLSQADFKFNRDPWIFDFEVVVSAWMVISVTTAAYLLGLFRLSHDTESNHVGAGRVLLSMSFLGLAAYLAIGLFAPRPPGGKLWENIQALAPPRLEHAHDGAREKNKPEANQRQQNHVVQHVDLRPEGPVIAHGGLNYGLDVRKALELAVREKRPLLVEFTGVNCPNCRKMERGPMARADVKDRLARFVKVQVFTDLWPPNKFLVDPNQALTDEEAEEILDLNRKLQQGWFKDITLPAYGIVAADPAVLDNPNGILNKHFGMENEQGEFTKFLDVGLSKWQHVQAQKEGIRAVNQKAASSSLVGSRN